MKSEEFDFILQEGEGLFIEFKESFDSKNIAKEIVAFTNSSGGKIFIGVSDDSNITGVDITNKLKSQITNIAKNCDPSIEIKLGGYMNVLIVEIMEGKNKPYSCSAGFFMRIGPNSQKLTRNEILNLSKSYGMIRFDEQVQKDFDWQDFDDEKFEYYLRLANISNNLNREDILRNLKLLNNQGFTNAGILLFAKKPYKYISNSKIRCVTFRGDNRVDILDKKEVDKGILDNIEFAINYVKEHTDVEFKIIGSHRVEYPEYPEKAYREAIVNAVVHRDYEINGEVAVEKLKNLIVINNPGGLLKYFPKNKFGKLSMPRNKLLANVLSRTIFMEKVGTGIKRIKDDCAKSGNKMVFDLDEYSFFVEIYSLKEKTTLKTTPKTKLLSLIKENPAITKELLSKNLNLSIDGVKYHIKKLKIEGKLKWVGPSKGGYWEVINDQ